MFRGFALRWWLWRRPKLFLVPILVCTLLLLTSIQVQSPIASSAQVTPASPQPQEQLPEPSIHPLPPALAQWQDSEEHGDYFSAILPTPVGYLVWSELPIQVWIEPANLVGSAFEVDRAQSWVEAVTQAIQEWSVYLPLEFVDSSETADIAIWRSAPPLQLSDNSQTEDASSTSGHSLPRIRSAETKYHLFVDRPANAPAKLSHRFTIQLTPDQTTDYIKATARHEMGHALGIWGHSPVESDALYFSQVRDAPPISDRDVNTLKRIYEQPTCVGWNLSVGD